MNEADCLDHQHRRTGVTTGDHNSRRGAYRASGLVRRRVCEAGKVAGRMTTFERGEFPVATQSRRTSRQIGHLEAVGHESAGQCERCAVAHAAMHSRFACRRFDSVLGHHLPKPNPSRLGFFIGASRGVARASGWFCVCYEVAASRPCWPGSTPLCSLFSRNRHKPLRRGTRRRRCATSTWTCATEGGLSCWLLERGTSRTASSGPAAAISTTHKTWCGSL